MAPEIDVGAVLDRVFRIYREQFPVLIQCSVIVFGLIGILNVAITAASAALALIVLLITLVGTFIFTGAIIELVADIQDDRRDLSVGELFSSVLPVLGQLVLVGLVAGIGTGIGFVFLIIPGLILLTIWSVAAPVVVLERPGGLRALGRSRELVRGNGWRVFAVIFVLFALVAVVSFVIEIGFSFSSAVVSALVASVVTIFTAPVQALGSAVLYFALRPPEPAPTPADPGIGVG
jgi:hypothetical protein